MSSSVSGAAFRDRARAESFGAVARDYDRYRPGYPTALVDDLVGLIGPSAGGRVLDIGCGTGKFTRALAERGVDVLGVEVDAQMAGVAREHGLQVEVADFESWDARGRRFDMVTCAQAWHWIDPQVAVAKAGGLLAAAGTLALFWNYGELDPELDAVVRAAYERVVPGWDGSIVVGFMKDDRATVGELRGSGLFAVVGTHTYRWSAEYSPAEWVGMVQTHSNHLLLSAEQRAAVAHELTAALTAEVGRHGRIPVDYGTYTVLARRPA